MRVLILDIFSRNGLAIVDALRSSHELVGGARGQGPSRRFFRSPALKDVFRYPSPLKDDAGFADAVFAACARYRAEAVFPASTASSLALSRLRADRGEPEGATFLVEELEKLLQLADKWQLYQLCTELGIRTPRTVLLGVSPPEDITALRLPVIAKPRAGEASRGVRILETRAELEQFADDPPLVGTDLGDSHPYIVQEIVRGENHGAGGCSFRGDVLTTTTGRSILTRHDFGGFGIVHETTSESAIAAQLAAIMRRLTWNGPLELESVRDDDGNFHAIDANPRIWGGVELAMAVGQDVPGLTLAVFTGGDVPAPATRSDAGLRMRWVTLHSVASCLRNPRTPRAVLSRLWTLVGLRRRSLTNIRRKNLRHLGGMVLEGRARTPA